MYYCFRNKKIAMETNCKLSVFPEMNLNFKKFKNSNKNLGGGGVFLFLLDCGFCWLAEFKKKCKSNQNTPKTR